MSAAEFDGSGSRPAKSSLLAPGRLLASLRPVAAMAVPIGAVTAIFWGLACLAYRQDANVTAPSVNLDADVIQEQLRRAEQSPPADLAFVGDSSCLFGIDPATLRERFPGKSIENFCTMAWVGPAGYGAQITQMVDHGTLPRNLVIHLHPDQFPRQPGWDLYVDIVKRGWRVAPAPVDPSPTAALDHARRTWLEPVLYRPVPGNLALYYGSLATLLRSMREQHGGLVNPGGSRFSSAEAMARFHRNWKPGPGTSYPLETTAAYEESLTELAKALRDLDRRHVFLLMAPVDYPLAPGPLAERDRIARWIAAKLDLPPDNIVSSPASLPRYLFIDHAHANRWGRVLLTRALASYLPPL